MNDLSSKLSDKGLANLGALVVKGGVTFRAWCPNFDCIDVVRLRSGEILPMQPVGEGYFERFVAGCQAGELYQYRLNSVRCVPDPASRFQPEGVHGPSQVINSTAYQWSEVDWSGVPREEMVFYELHVGTFSPTGNYTGVEERLEYLKELGVTAIELLPIAEFAGRWNWGYDLVALYAPFHGYGEPDELRRLIDRAHQLGIAVFLDMVYNHFGPDGCYATEFAKFLTDKHQSPWGQGINLDDDGCEGVRKFLIENAVYWLNEFRFDGLRLDAVHTLIDDSEVHFLKELSAAVAEVPGAHRYLFAEDARNLNQLLYSREAGGFGLDGIWADDFHHQVRNLVAGDKDGYFRPYEDSTAGEIAKSLRYGWYFTGQPTTKFAEPHGTDTTGLSLDHFVICIQNHDQVGNRPTGARLHHEIEFSMWRAVSALFLFAPETPLLFMGQEWAAATPFRYFTDHVPAFGEAITQGRKTEFKDFGGFQGEVPDPQSPESFLKSKLNWSELDKPFHQRMLRLYRDLIAVRRELTASAAAMKDIQITVHGDRAMTLRRSNYQLIVCLGEGLELPIAEGAAIDLTTEDERYSIDGRPPIRAGLALRFPCPAAVVAVLR